jgi:hypothetical protein
VIPVPRPGAAPEGFAERCTEPGRRWLESHPLNDHGDAKSPQDFWSDFEPQLRAVFHERCGWLAMWIPRGQIEHYRSKHHPDPARRRAQRPLAYDWSNLRYADASVNNLKRNHDEAVLDPYEVGAGWFALNAALELTVTSACPEAERARARFTLTTLGLERGTVATRLRAEYLRTYQHAIEHGMDPSAALAELDRRAPQLAEYVRPKPVAVAP